VPSVPFPQILSYIGPFVTVSTAGFCAPWRNLPRDSPCSSSLLSQGEHPKALRYLIRLAAIATKSFGPDHPLSREAVEKRDALRESTPK